MSHVCLQIERGEMKVHVDDVGDHVCEHGTALDVHCCNCHSGFIFDLDHECPPLTDEQIGERLQNVGLWPKRSAAPFADVPESAKRDGMLDNWRHK